MNALLLLALACDSPDPAPDPGPDGADTDDTDPAVDTDLDTDDPDDTDCEPLSWYPDADGDGWGAGAELLACEAPAAHAAAAGDCDDADPFAHPDAEDPDCDGVDADCDGVGTDDVWLVAVNGDVSGLDPVFVGTAGAPIAWEAERNGVVTFCPGTWYATIDVTGYAVTLRGLDAAATTIAAEGAGPVIAVRTDAYVTIEGLTLTGGVAADGGGVVIDAPNPAVTLRDAIVEGNTASGRGGGVYVGGGELVVERVKIRDNAAATGGGIGGDGAWTIADSRIEGNLAVDGGGLWAGAARPTVSRTAVAGNVASGAGGGLWVGEGGAILEDALVTGNSAASGGGLFVSGLADVACLAGGGVLGNAADSGGGAAVTSTGTLYSTVCDWGGGATDNAPSDVHLDDLVVHDLGAAESFRCDGDTSRCEPR